MADRHTIVVRVKDGRVIDVLFCDCCTGVTLRVRTYSDALEGSAVKSPAANREGGMITAVDRASMRDHVFTNIDSAVFS